MRSPRRLIDHMLHATCHSVGAASSRDTFLSQKIKYQKFSSFENMKNDYDQNIILPVIMVYLAVSRQVECIRILDG